MFGLFKRKPKRQFNPEMFPSLDWLNKINEEARDFTPDAWHLERMFLHNVFIYNELQTGQHSYKKVMEGHVRKLAAARTLNTHYVMWKKRLGEETFPFALETTPDMKWGNSTLLGYPSRIIGQLFTMRPSQVKRLDSYLLNTVQFTRKRVAIEIPCNPLIGSNPGPRKIVKLRAWMYIARFDFWRDMLADKNICALVKQYTAKSDLDKYYFYNGHIESNT